MTTEQDSSNGKKKEGTKAVKGVSFGVKKGEIFSLLGVNGAGKTSIFRCMVGDESISGGEILLMDQEVGTFYNKPWLLDGIVGYCPQYDRLDSGLTVVQSLTLMCRLCGVDPTQVQSVVMSMVTKVGLIKYKDVKAGKLSGGNKRKLCLAMAMVGRPSIIYIDEASTGVDPASRRLMWKAIKDEGAGSAVVLTTHAMEEAEAISSKISIMVKGKLRCFGTL